MIINKKQVCALLFTLIPASKFLLLPSVYARFAHQDAWLAGLINCLMDGLLLAAALVFIKRFKGKTFFKVIEDTSGAGFARAIYVIYAVYFILKAAVPVYEHKKFIEISLYETTPSVFTFIPFFALAFYFCLKGLKVMARTGEILLRFTVIGFALAIVLSIFECDLFYLLPIMKNPVNLTLNASYSGLIWYGQPLILFFLAGRIKPEKHFNISVIASFAAAALLCVTVYALFTGIYGDLAPRQTYAINKMTKYSLFSANTLRFDYIVTLLLTAGSVLALAAPLAFAADCVKTAFGGIKPWIFSLSLCAAACVTVLLTPLYFRAIIDFFEKFFTPVMAFLAYAAPVLITIFGKNRKDKKESNTYETALEK